MCQWLLWKRHCRHRSRRSAGKLSIVNTTLGFATTTDIQCFGVPCPFDGVFGFAFAGLAEGDATPPFLLAIEQGLVDEPLISVFMETEGSNATHVGGGAMTFGGYDRDNCGDVLGYGYAVQPDYDWLFRMENVSVGAVNITAYDYFEINGLSDTGTAAIIGPVDSIKQIAALAGATFSDDYGVYTIPCDATYDPIAFAINGTFYYITSDVLNMDIHLVDTKNSTVNVCLFGLVPWASANWAYWIMGAPFIRAFCHFYDFGEARLGFANPLYAL